ncbi:MAG: MBL fold metallo-hydrolase [Mucilaginibacter sp.]|uniref:MBL fold metallo-hydrolase n=1 Tax=Mucilaginibacter sp. TaxID=1882438 RepID=UPI0031AF242F
MQLLKTIKYNLLTGIIGSVVLLFSCLDVNGQEKGPIEMDQPFYHHMKLGDYDIIALSDGTVPINLHEVLTDITPDKIDQLSAAGFQTTTSETSVNAYLIKANGKNILIDAGTAELYGPTLGHLPENLRKIGVPPEAIDAVLITHIHSDHTGGLMQGSKMVFPNAMIYISKPELDFWLNEDNKIKAPERLVHWFKEAEDKVGPYVKAGKVKTFGYGKELFPGIKPIAAPGHTPGHTFYSIESKGQKLVFVGDLVHAAAVQFPDPSATINFDVDSKAAAATRLLTFRDAAANGYWLAADHISFPGIGHVRKNGTGFLWVPLNYSTLGVGQ